MLIDIETGRPIESIPYRSDFEIARRRLSDAEFQAMVDRINELIDESGGEIATAGWLPGSDWTGTAFEPIYSRAARGDFERSAKFFGQLVWYTVMKRPEQWASGRYQLDGKDIGSRTYFRLGSGERKTLPQELESGLIDRSKDRSRWRRRRSVSVPASGRVAPSPEYLEWHADAVFRR